MRGWQKWQEVFADLISNIDATAFAIMEVSKLIPEELPTVRINNPGPGAYEFEALASAVFISRTFNTRISIPLGIVPIEPESILGFQFTPGAVGPQVSQWESIQGGLTVEPGFIPVGYVRSDGTIYYFNGAYLPLATNLRLFEFPGGAGGTDQVKVTGTDTTADYLDAKIVGKAGEIVTTVLNLGANENLEISLASPPLSGLGNPNVVPVVGVLGQTYYDTGAGIHYICDDTGLWSVI